MSIPEERTVSQSQTSLESTSAIRHAASQRWLLGLAVVALWTVFGVDTAGAQAPAAVVERLTHEANPERAAAFSDLRAARRDTVAALIELLDHAGELDSIDGGPRQLAIALLGDYRASEAVDALTEHLLYVPDELVRTERLPRERYHSAAAALVDIGLPSVDAMLTLIRNDREPRRRQLAAWVLREVLGEIEAVRRLRERAPARTDRRFEQFETAIEFIETYQPVFEPPVEPPAVEEEP